MTSALERLRARREVTGAPVCVGIDPHPGQLPEGLPPDVTGVESFARGIIEAAGPHATAIKINVAFFEAFGAAGWAALERARRDVPRDIVCLLDAKRGDIGSTAERYADGLFGHLDADAVTLSPYLGEDAVEPFLRYDDRLIYVLARTSNQSAGRVQDLESADEPIYVAVARWVAETWTDGRVGLVVGATFPREMNEVRAAAPGPGFLVPGVGAQGGDLEAAVAACDGAWAPGLITISRGIAGASRGPSWRSAAASAAEALGKQMREAVLHSSASAATRPTAEVRD